MGTRKQSEKHAIELSKTYTDSSPEPKQKKRRGAPSLYRSWGGDDCIWFFRWSGAAIGFRGQNIEPPAETKREGRRILPLWDYSAADVGKAMKVIARLDAELAKPGLTTRARNRLARFRLAYHVEFTRATVAGEDGKARPRSIGGTRVRTNPDRVTDEHLVAARQYRRISAGMDQLRLTDPAAFAVLEAVFLPMPCAPELEQAFGHHYAWLALRLPRILKSHSMATQKAPVSLETWLLRRVEKSDSVIPLAREDAENMALAAVKAYEKCSTPPPEIVKAEADRVASEATPKSRRPRSESGIKFISVQEDAECLT